MTDKHDVPLWGNSLQEFRNRVAAASATPGGAAVAAVSATFAAALLRMVCAISAKRKPNEAIDAIGVKVKTCEEKLAHCAEEDIRVFKQYMAVRKAHGGSATAEVQRGLLACTTVPLAAAEEVVKLEFYAAEIDLHCPKFLSSDLATGRHLLHASRRGLLANVSINLADMEDGEAKRAVVKRLDDLQRDVNLGITQGYWHANRNVD